MADPIPGNTTPPADTSWFAGFDDTTKSHMVAKGYDKLDAPAAFLAAHEAYKGAESKLGLPSERVLKIPDASDSEGWKAVHSKLGVPADPSGYDFSGVKDAAGQSLPENTVSWLRENALKLNMTPTAAVGWATALLGRDTVVAADKRAADAATLGAEQAQLDAEWGGNKVRNEFLVQRAAAMLGRTAAQMEELKSRPGFSAEMKGLLNMAVKMGEAELIGAGAGQGGGWGSPGGRAPLSPDEAVARLDDIRQGRDKDFARRYHNGNPAEKAAAVVEWKSLTELSTRARMSGVGR